MAAAVATVPGLDEPGEDTSVSCRPNALVLFNPVFDNSPEGYGYDRVKDRYREISPIVDSHLVIDKDLVISGPAGTQVRLVGASNQPEDDTSQPLTWHSRMVYVAPGVTAELENLELTGGNFIYFGAGINNDGTLTIAEGVALVEV